MSDLSPYIKIYESIPYNKNKQPLLPNIIGNDSNSLPLQIISLDKANIFINELVTEVDNKLNDFFNKLMTTNTNILNMNGKFSNNILSFNSVTSSNIITNNIQITEYQNYMLELTENTNNNYSYLNAVHDIIENKPTNLFTIRKLNNLTKKKYTKISSNETTDCKEQMTDVIDDVCPICLCEYEENEEIIILPCKHYSHNECVSDLFSHDVIECPLCKTLI